MQALYSVLTQLYSIFYGKIVKGSQKIGVISEFAGFYVKAV
jgi:hypothetical protein